MAVFIAVLAVLLGLGPARAQESKARLGEPVADSEAGQEKAVTEEAKPAPERQQDQKDQEGQNEVQPGSTEEVIEAPVVQESPEPKADVESAPEEEPAPPPPRRVKRAAKPKRAKKAVSAKVVTNPPAPLSDAAPPPPAPASLSPAPVSPVPATRFEPFNP